MVDLVSMILDKLTENQLFILLLAVAFLMSSFTFVVLYFIDRMVDALKDIFGKERIKTHEQHRL